MYANLSSTKLIRVVLTQYLDGGPVYLVYDTKNRSSYRLRSLSDEVLERLPNFFVKRSTLESTVVAKFKNTLIVIIMWFRRTFSLLE